MGRSRYKIYQQDAPHFLTCTVIGWLPLFAHPQVARIVLDALQFMYVRGRLTLYAYVVMENHLHLLVAADDLSTQIGRFKSYTARQVIDWLNETGRRSILKQLSALKARHKKDRAFQFWQEGSHPQQIRGEMMLRQKISYIHENPVRRGYVDEPVHWRYSSARTYAGQPGLLDVEIAL